MKNDANAKNRRSYANGACRSWAHGMYVIGEIRKDLKILGERMNDKLIERPISELARSRGATKGP
jgi:hypothetical protein